ncbi:molybdopterin-dependent oxidoreductase [Ruania alba]|uniref:Oxidoreductase molybdopterin binding domain-containing protein n=1 Tax=Ruania alba TaxID=648782 RepID=A0A1H5KR58_9MICO|nr:molybdopterin-dependent oxidoreductase [Ruania alba]SEE66541.1 Oxidoreductase molybdopterin binding domain-containing protein [Ruania alba]
MRSRSGTDPAPKGRPIREVELPPGQRLVGGFPRFGTHLHEPPPPIPPEPAITITGAVVADHSVLLTDLDGLSQVERTEDFHCVAGWSAAGVCWGGVPFATFYRAVIEPRLTAPATHLGFRGYDDFASVVQLEDALADDVLLATRLDQKPLTPMHGAPVRLVSPSQYGFVSTKHLARIEVHASRPRREDPYDVLTREHPRARVWQEERHAWFSGQVMRRIYRPLIRPILRLSARGLTGQDRRADGGERP